MIFLNENDIKIITESKKSTNDISQCIHIMKSILIK